MNLSNLTPQQRARIAYLQSLQAWAKQYGITLTKDNYQAVEAMRASGMRTQNSRRDLSSFYNLN